MNSKDWAYVTIGGAVLVTGYMMLKKASNVLGETFTETLNPLSSKNLAAQGSDSFAQTVSGEKNTSFGSWIFDLLNPNQIDITAPTPYYLPDLNVDYLP